MLKQRLSFVAFWLFTGCCYRCCIIVVPTSSKTITITSAWSIIPFLSRRQQRHKNRHRHRRPDQTTSLVNHLEQGLSHLDSGLSIIQIDKTECGVQYQQGRVPENEEADDDDENENDDENVEQEIVRIDRNEFVTPSCGQATSVGKALTEYLLLQQEEEKGQQPSSCVVEQQPAIYISIFLCLVQSGQVKDSIQQDYIQSLPNKNELQHLPIFWKDNTLLQELQGTALLKAIHERRKTWYEEYNTILLAINQQQQQQRKHHQQQQQQKRFVDFDTWCWARSIITSRAFNDETAAAGDGNGVCLVPFVDMLNHHCSGVGVGGGGGPQQVTKCQWNIQKDGFHLSLPSSSSSAAAATATEKSSLSSPPSSSEQLLSTIEISYGSHSNAARLMNYGFTILDDEEQTCQEDAMWSMGLDRNGDDDENENNNNEIETLWQQDGGINGGSSLRNVTLTIGNPGPAESLLSLCRVVSCKNQELSQMKIDFHKRGERENHILIPLLAATISRMPFSIPNEIRAMQTLQQLTLTQLTRYQTTLQEDNQLLRRCEDEGSSASLTTRKHNLRNAIIVRRGEKRVLEHFSNLAYVCLEFLSSSSSSPSSSDESGVDFDEYKNLLEASLDQENPLLNMEFAASAAAT